VWPQPSNKIAAWTFPASRPTNLIPTVDVRKDGIAYGLGVDAIRFDVRALTTVHLWCKTNGAPILNRKARVDEIEGCHGISGIVEEVTSEVHRKDKE
jgi:hypothetical protein